MSLARHRLTSSKIALHHARHTYQDETGGESGGHEIIVYPKGTYDDEYDGDSCLISPSGQLTSCGYSPCCDQGEEMPWHSDVTFACGAAPDGNLNEYNYRQQQYRPVMRFDISQIPSNATIKSARLYITILSQIGASCNGSDDVIVEHTVNINRCRKDVDARYASWCHYDDSNEWTAPGADSASDHWLGNSAQFQAMVYPEFPYHQSIDFDDIVQTAVSYQQGDLNTVWNRDADKNPTECTNLYLGGDNNKIYIASGQYTAPESYRPYLVINWV